ncbi:MAG: hypothetical protein NPIRA04_24920 [Nitrospirales bacterium]|nr:MAG: hypothetical protein NPIRA04_24920 [Nitrospirales bacterium]
MHVLLRLLVLAFSVGFGGMILVGFGIQQVEAFGGILKENSPFLIPVITPSPFPHMQPDRDPDRQPESQLPEEPDEFDKREVEAFYDWRNDMFFRHFDMTGSGAVNYMTARRTYKVWLDDYGTPSVITVADPLFYWIDLNNNGRFEQELGEIWVDSYEDGLTGNEKPYDNSDLQQAPTEVPLWSVPDPSGSQLPPYNSQ